MIKPDRQTIMQVIGSLMHKPQYLSDTDKYILEVNDFDTTFDRYIFLAIHNLYKSGAERIHAIDIDNYLQNDAAGAKIVMENKNGIQFLNECEANCETGNFTYYYNKLKKFNLLRDFQKEGYDISEFYAENLLIQDSFDINAKFEKLTVDDILNKIKGKISVIEKSYLTNAVVQEGKAYDGIRELIKELKEVPEVGCNLQGDHFNTIARGGRKGKLYLRSAASGCGKAIPNYTIIPTSTGYRKVGDINVGDYLFDRNGNPTKVLAVYPQSEKKQIYKIYFKSGKIAECCEDHLWAYKCNRSRKEKLNVKSLKEIIEMTNKNGFKDNNGGFRYSIPINKALNYTKKDLPIDPYVLGLILGDGSFRYTDSQKAFSFSSENEELPAAICKRMGYRAYKKCSQFNYNWFFKNNYKSHENVWVEDILEKYPKLWNVKSEGKFIPEEYFFGSIEQRKDLLSGLLDTDGCIDKKGRISYVTISPFLKDGVVKLCESLGYIAKVSLDNRFDKYVNKNCYIIHIQASKEEKSSLFKLKRKKEIALNYLNNKKRTENREWDSIINIEKTELFADMTCFTVDNDEHLFLMNNGIVSHNTRSMVGDACYIAYPIRWENGEWISSGREPQKVLYTATEQDVDEIQTMILAYLTGINEEKFLYGTFTEEEMPRIEYAINIMEKYQDYMLTARIPNPCSSVVKNLFRRYNLQYGVENFFYDYIFSSPAMLNEYRDLAIREDEHC